jgi:hypothetical protein
MRKVVVFLIALACFSPISPAVGEGALNFNFGERQPGVGLGNDTAVSYMQGFSPEDGGRFNQHLCKTMQDKQCTSMKAWELNTIAPVCSEGKFKQCIDSLLVDIDGVTTQAKYVHSAGEINYQANDLLSTPAAGSTSIWSATDSQGQERFYAVKLAVSYVGNGATPGNISSMSTQILRVNRISAPGFDFSIAEHTWPSGNISVDGSGGPNDSSLNCIYFWQGECGNILNEPIEKATLTAHVDNRVTGWMSARLDKPEIKVTPVDSTTNLLSVTGSSVAVPTIQKLIARSALPAEYQNWGAGAGGTIPPGDIGIWSLSRDRNTINQFLKLQNFLDNKATAISNVWSIRALPQSQNQCISSTSKLLGLVMTNATTYEVNPPTFENGTLNYKVAALHYLNDRAVFQGSYNLLLDSNAARCLYGFSKAPISASISILGDSASTQVATTSMKESDGWIYLRASGFTFSNPTISVKINQAVEPAPVASMNPTPSTSPAPSVAPSTPAVTVVKPAVKQVTITCVKGKTSKKVSGTKPVCPSGYKKK